MVVSAYIRTSVATLFTFFLRFFSNPHLSRTKYPRRSKSFAPSSAPVPRVELTLPIDNITCSTFWQHFSFFGLLPPKLQSHSAKSINNFHRIITIGHCQKEERRPIFFFSPRKTIPLTQLTMHLMYTLDSNGNRLYTLKKIAHGQVTKSAHPARFSPDDKWSRQRVTTKKRFGLLLTQQSRLMFVPRPEE